MAMSGVDGKAFTITPANTLSGAPLGSFLKTHKWIPPMLVVGAVTFGAYLLIKKMRGE